MVVEPDEEALHEVAAPSLVDEGHLVACIQPCWEVGVFEKIASVRNSSCSAASAPGPATDPVQGLAVVSA